MPNDLDNSNNLNKTWRFNFFIREGYTPPDPQQFGSLFEVSRLKNDSKVSGPAYLIELEQVFAEDCGFMSEPDWL